MTIIPGIIRNRARQPLSLTTRAICISTIIILAIITILHIHQESGVFTDIWPLPAIMIPSLPICTGTILIHIIAALAYTWVMAQIHFITLAITGIPGLACLTHISPACTTGAHLAIATGAIHSTIHFFTGHLTMATDIIPVITPVIMVVIMVVIMAIPTIINMFTTVTTAATTITGRALLLGALQEPPTGETCSRRPLLSVLKHAQRAMQPEFGKPSTGTAECRPAQLVVATKSSWAIRPASGLTGQEITQTVLSTSHGFLAHKTGPIRALSLPTT